MKMYLAEDNKTCIITKYDCDMINEIGTAWCNGCTNTKKQINENDSLETRLHNTETRLRDMEFKLHDAELKIEKLETMITIKKHKKSWFNKFIGR